jgi:ubiquitin-protein ligase
MSSVRLRRLQADSEKLRDYIRRHPRLQLIQAEGTPPERYQIEYRIKSLRQKDGQLEEVGSHLVEVSLPRDYPRVPPQCRMLTPVFHPNIAPHAICIGDHWSAGESLSALVARIGEMLAYQSYNTRSPLNGEAARWTDQNLARLPLDAVSMAAQEPQAEPGQPPAPPPSFAAAPPSVARRRRESPCWRARDVAPS